MLPYVLPIVLDFHFAFVTKLPPIRVHMPAPICTDSVSKVRQVMCQALVAA